MHDVRQALIQHILVLGKRGQHVPHRRAQEEQDWCLQAKDPMSRDTNKECFNQCTLVDVGCIASACSSHASDRAAHTGRVLKRKQTL